MKLEMTNSVSKIKNWDKWKASPIESREWHNIGAWRQDKGAEYPGKKYDSILKAHEQNT